MGKIEIVDPQTGEIYEYDESRITKLRAGAAYGANDIQNWSSRRIAGREGVFDRNAAKKQRKRALELSKLAGRPIKSFDGSIQYAKPPKKKKKASKKLTPYQLYKKIRRRKLGIK